MRTDDSDGDHPLALSRSVTPSKDGADNPRDRDSSLTSVTECDNTFTHSDLHNAPESNKFNKNILFCWRHDPARRELMGDFYDSKTRITNGAFTLALSSQPLNWALFMIDLTELNFYCSNFLRKKNHFYWIVFGRPYIISVFKGQLQMKWRFKLFWEIQGVIKLVSYYHHLDGSKRHFWVFTRVKFFS